MKKSTFLLLFVFCLTTHLVNGQKTDYAKFVKETQKSISKPGSVGFVWWIPVEFWEITFKRQTAELTDQQQEMINVLSPYTIFAIVDGKMGPYGGVTYITKDSIRDSIELQDLRGKIHKPLDEYELNGDVLNLLTAMNPMLKNMMGKLGENLNFYVFRAMDKDKNRYTNPLEKGFFSIKYLDKQLEWRLPIGSLLAPKKCAITNEVMNGAWEFCPYHGNKLETIE